VTAYPYDGSVEAAWRMIQCFPNLVRMVEIEESLILPNPEYIYLIVQAANGTQVLNPRDWLVDLNGELWVVPPGDLPKQDEEKEREVKELVS